MPNPEFGSKLMPEPKIPAQPNPEGVQHCEPLHPVFTQERFHTGEKLNWENHLTPILKRKVDESPNRLLSWSTFMETSLFHPEFGYYSNTEIGKDFHTHPELLSSFGAHVGQSPLNLWTAIGKPHQFQIEEMGAGNGSLALSLLKWAKYKQPDFYNAIQYKIIEKSPGLIEKQKEKLSYFNREGIHKVEFTEESAIDYSPSNIEGAFISNELPDAFAVERVTRLKNGEIVQKYSTEENGEWVEVWGEPSPEVSKYIVDHEYKIEEGVEEPINLAAATWMENIASKLKRGVILTIDYGRWGQVGEKNFASVKNFGKVNGDHVKGYEDMFSSYKAPGMIDITTNIDFGVLKQITVKSGLDIAFSGEQSEFLLRNGLGEEIQELEAAWKRTGSLYLGIPYQTAVTNATEGTFCVLLATKGIDSGKIMGGKSTGEFKMPIVEIPLTDDTKKVIIVFESKYGEEKIVEGDCSTSNSLTFRPRNFQNTVIYDVSSGEEKKLYDFGGDVEKIDEFIYHKGWIKGVTD
jgi:SAM-dependent MidA family methyltransferase